MRCPTLAAKRGGRWRRHASHDRPDPSLGYHVRASSQLGACEETTPYPLTRALAEQGNAEAQFSLGVAYDTGQGVAQDSAEALRWYRLAADQGPTEAQFNLGVMYDDGKGVHRTMPRRHDGFALRPTRGMPRRSSTLG